MDNNMTGGYAIRGILIALSLLGTLELIGATGVASYTISSNPSAIMVAFASGPESRGFSWQTDESISESEVRLVEGAASPHDYETTPLVFTGSCVRVGKPAAHSHKVVVKGLKRGIAYSYRLGGAGHYAYGRTDVKSPNDFVTIVNFNDVQLSDPGKLHMWDNTLAASVREVGGSAAVDFIVNGGDFIDGRMRMPAKGIKALVGCLSNPMGCSVEWGIAAEPVAMFYPGVPWVSSSGDHDSLEYGNRIAVEYPTGLPLGCESLDYGNVHVVALPFVASVWSRRHEEIMDWLEADLAANAATGKSDWRIVCVHWGPNTTGDHGMRAPGTTNLVVRLGGICASNKVDLVLQAHDHTFSKTLPYRWGGTGWTVKDNDSEVVNLVPKKNKEDSGIWDVDPNGTYYLSCGCAGHRVGENAKYASQKGKKSYRNRRYKIATGTLAVDSKWGCRGDPASMDIPRSMFGVMHIDGNRLKYDFFVVNKDGSHGLVDSLCILKTRSLGSPKDKP